jgi:hypothetical protein
MKTATIGWVLLHYRYGNEYDLMVVLESIT